MEDMSCQPLLVNPKNHFLSASEFDASFKEYYPSRSDIYNDPAWSKTAYSAYCGSVYMINSTNGIVAVPAMYADRLQRGIRNAVTATKIVKDSGEMVTILVHKKWSGMTSAQLRWYRPLENKPEARPSSNAISEDDKLLESLIHTEMRSTDAPEEFSDNNDFVIWLEFCLERFAHRSYETRQLVIRCRSLSSEVVIEGNGRVLTAAAGAEMSALGVDAMVADALAEVARKSKRERKPTEKVLMAAKYAPTETTKSRKRERGVAGPEDVERPNKKKKTSAAVRERKRSLATFYEVTSSGGNQYRSEFKLTHSTWTLSADSTEERRREETRDVKDSLKRESSRVDDGRSPQIHYILRRFAHTRSEGRQLYSNGVESESGDARTTFLKMRAFESNTKTSKVVEEVFEEKEVKRGSYCICRPSKKYEEWVGCENDDCEVAWYHLRCVGLEKKPPKNQDWYCAACRGEDSTQPRGRKGQAGARYHTCTLSRGNASVTNSN